MGLKVDEADIEGGHINSQCAGAKCVDSYLDDEQLFFKYVKEGSDTYHTITVKGTVGKISYDKAHFGKWAICPGEGKLESKDECFFSTVPVNSPGIPSLLEFYDASSENKTVVGKAKFTCEEKKSVFKAVF